MLYQKLNMISHYVIFVCNFLYFRQKKKMLGGVSLSAMEYFSSKEQKAGSRLLASPAVWTIAEILIISLVQILSAQFNLWLGDIFGTGANYFGKLFFTPVTVVIFCILLKIDYLAQMDLITPAFPLSLFFAKLGCQAAGCCRGMPWAQGIYNPFSRTIEFPSQLTEAGVALVLFILLVCCRSRLKKGTAFPIYLIAYSSIRFFTEFLRCEPDVFLGLKVYHIFCLAGVLTGILELVAVGKYKAYLQKKTEESGK